MTKRTAIAGIWKIRYGKSHLHPQRQQGYRFEIVDSLGDQAFISPIATPTGREPTFKQQCKMSGWVYLEHLVEVK